MLNRKLEVIVMIYQEPVEKSIEAAATFGEGNEQEKLDKSEVIDYF